MGLGEFKILEREGRRENLL